MPDLWDKKYKCPICGSTVISKKIFTDKVKIKSYDPDLKPNYDGVNALIYSVVVCETCYYAALESDFEAQVSPIYLSEIKEVQKKLKVNKEVLFSRERDHKTALLAYAIASLYYNVKKQPCKNAEMHLRMAWLFREINDSENELKSLAKAFLHFEECYNTSYIDQEKEPMIVFYLGELAFRLGKIEDAKRWFSILVTKYRDSHSFYVKAGKDRWQEIKEK